ncbi:MAG: phenylacetate--CoA ligase [Eubacteriales bacterium]|nr:phenylacetate--CoA ligase [Eubacteriales bacterium]
MFWNEEMETMPREQLKELQGERLKKTVELVYNNVEHYREKMDAAGVKPEDIKSVEDLSKLPFTTYHDLADVYPFGMASAPVSECVRLQASSGTTGKPKISIYTRTDLDVWTECSARCLTMGGLTKDDILMVGYGYHLFTGGLGAHQGGEAIGALVIPMGGQATTKIIDFLIDMKVTAIACTPSYLLHVAEVAEEMGVIDKLSLRISFNGAEPWTNEMRQRLDSKLHIKTFDIYGLTELCGPGVADDCEYRTGLHIWEDHFIPEIIDPNTGEVLPEGSTGELVITSITRDGMPLIRYRTRDLTHLEYEKCKCGRTHARIQRFVGRSDDMLIIKGVNVFPTQVEAVLLTVPGTTPNYFITVDRVDEQDTFQIEVEIEESYYSDDAAKMEALRAEIKKAIKGVIGLNAKIVLVYPNGLEHGMGKTKHVLDKRKLFG